MNEYYRQGRKITRMSILNGWATPGRLLRQAIEDLETAGEKYMTREFALGMYDEATFRMEQEESK